MEDRLVKGLDHVTEKIEKVNDHMLELSTQHTELRTRIEAADPSHTPFYKDKKVQAHGGLGAVFLAVLSTVLSAGEDSHQQHIVVEAASTREAPPECDPLTEFCED
jgi:hypothetical protein